MIIFVGLPETAGINIFHHILYKLGPPSAWR
jgi:hypothetical protein